MNFKNKKILVLAPHPDDAEFGCGATLARLIKEGATIKYLVFSPCNKSLPKNYKPEHLYSELKAATAHLGITEQSLMFYHFPVRDFPAYRQDILEELVKVKKSYQPELVFLPNSKDVHQDHKTISEEGIRAFKNASLLGYELSWNNYSFDNDFYFRIEMEHLDQKLKAIEEYQSQAFRHYKENQTFESLAKLRGLQINYPLAECYELIRFIA